MATLRECPFCGGKAELMMCPDSNKWLVLCINKCCNQFPHQTSKDAIDAWNRRIHSVYRRNTDADRHS